MSIFEQIFQADKIISSIRKELNYQIYLTPTNFKNENAHFIECYKNGEKYNPQYEYVHIDSSELNKQWNEIDQFENDETGISQIIRKNIFSLKNEIYLYEVIGNNDLVTDASILVYGNADTKLSYKAIKDLKQDRSSDNLPAKYNAYDLRNAITERLNKYGFTWNVVVRSTMASRISVEPEYNTIFINQNGQFTDNDLIRLLVHEIDTHVLRTENGRRHGLNIFSGDSPVVLKDEEGLALYNEYTHHVQDEYSRKLYAARFLCCCNLNLSFYELFDMLISFGCSMDLSLYVVSRIKRGLSDTSLPGGYNKDYVYYQGLNDMLAIMKQDCNAFRNLYFGAVSYEDTKMLNKEINRFKDIILPLPI